MSQINIGQVLELPQDIDCYGYGADPLPNGETVVTVTSIELIPKAIRILAKGASGKTIRFVMHLTEQQIYSNTIANIKLALPSG